MKIIYTALFLLFALNYSFCQTESEKYLEEIKNESTLKNEKLEQEITSLKDQIEKIDKDILNAQTDKEELDALKERVKILEKIEKNNLAKKSSILSENYSSAIINLISLEKDIQPVNLYNTATSFHRDLEKISNPTNYGDFSNWLSEYEKFLNKTKTSDVLIDMASKLINTTGFLSNKTLNLGPASEIIFSSIEKFIQSLGTSSSKKKLREQSAQMFELLIVLKNFESEKWILDEKFNDLAEELKQLEETQKSVLVDVIKTSGLTKSLMQIHYFEESDPSEIHSYLGRLKSHLNDNINKFNKKEIYHQMSICQSLKIRFGDILEDMAKNLKEYDELIKKYKTNEILNLTGLESKYNTLENQFKNYYNGEKIKLAALKMYRYE